MVKNSKGRLFWILLIPFPKSQIIPCKSVFVPGIGDRRHRGSLYTVKATYGDTLIGGITLSKRYGTVILDYVAVTEEYKGKHIGKTLVEMALNHAKGLGINELFLVTKVEGFVKLGAVRTEGIWCSAFGM